MNLKMIRKALDLIRADLEHFDLRQLLANLAEPGEPLCGTVGCVVGWGCTLPEAAALGIEVKDSSVYRHGFRQYADDYRMLAADLFDVGGTEAHKLFCAPMGSDYDRFLQPARYYVLDRDMTPAQQLELVEGRLALHCKEHNIDPAPLFA